MTGTCFPARAPTARLDSRLVASAGGDRRLAHGGARRRAADPEAPLPHADSSGAQRTRKSPCANLAWLSLTQSKNCLYSIECLTPGRLCFNVYESCRCRPAAGAANGKYSVNVDAIRDCSLSGIGKSPATPSPHSGVGNLYRFRRAATGSLVNSWSRRAFVLPAARQLINPRGCASQGSGVLRVRSPARRKFLQL